MLPHRHRQGLTERAQTNLHFLVTKFVRISYNHHSFWFECRKVILFITDEAVEVTVQRYPIIRYLNYAAREV